MLSFFTLKLPEEAKKIEIFPKFQRWMEKTNIFMCKPPEVHFTITNRVPYNKLLTNRACSSRTGEYWPSVVFVRTSLRSVRTVTTSGQYSPVRPSRSVSKRLVLTQTLQTRYLDKMNMRKQNKFYNLRNNLQGPRNYSRKPRERCWKFLTKRLKGP